MKLTREQVSQLSDVELNLGMTWFYSGSDKGLNGRYIDGELYYNMGTGRIYEYLDDYNLTMPLAHKLNLIIDLAGEYPDDGSICWSQFKEYAADSINPLRAICEVLLMIAMERDQ